MSSTIIQNDHVDHWIDLIGHKSSLKYTHPVVPHINGVGKSNLVLRFVVDYFVQEYDSTIKDEYRKHYMLNNNQQVLVDIMDTEGKLYFH